MGKLTELESSYNVSTVTQRQQGGEQLSALQIRLADVNQLIENIEMFLRGTKLVIEQDHAGNVTTRSQSIGEPIANPRGVQKILNWIQLILNTQVVQGNFPVDNASRSTMYEDYIYHVRVDLMSMLVTNCFVWEVNEQDLDLIIDQIMNAIEPFMTRLIGNKERESYENTVRHSEHTTLQEGNTGKFNFFGRNKQ